MSLHKLINKATDPTLTADNWQYNLDVCDKVLEKPEENCGICVELIKDRLTTQRDANVLLRTLSLLVAIAENCGSRVQQEIATKSFTQVLLNKLKDPSTHKEIKTKVVQVITQLKDSFSKDPSLRPIQDAYKEVSLSYPQYFPPSKPQKQALDAEDEDLKAAIELSLRESQAQQQYQQQYQQPQVQQLPQQQFQQQSQQPQAPIQQQPQQRTFSRVRALYDSFSTDPADLKFHKGDVITVIERVYKDWGKGSLRGNIGLFPFNYVTPLYDPTPEELANEVRKEEEILAKSKQIEKLLVLLTNAQSEDEAIQLTQSEEFKQMYQDIVLIKPELANLIDKYRQRKDDLMDLYKKLKTATNTYEEITDPLRQPQYQHQYVPQPQVQTPQTPHTPSVSQQQITQMPQAQQTPQVPQAQPQQQQYPQQQQQQYSQQYQPAQHTQQQSQIPPIPQNQPPMAPQYGQQWQTPYPQ